jgi:hypothetical protein
LKVPFPLKIGEDFNIDDSKGKKIWIDELFFIINLNTYGLKAFSTLKLMKNLKMWF